jgi:hypothetical protein
VAGAILGPLFVLGNAIAAGGNHELLLFVVVLMVPCGAFLGYLNGTCAAGIFLVMDKVERYLKGSSASDSPMLPPAVPAS